MSNPTWELRPRVGIESGAIRVFLGMERQDLRNTLSQLFLPPAQSNYPDEDDFLTRDKSTFVRIRYEREQVRDIEFLGGFLRYQDIDLHSGAHFKELEEEFGELGLTFRPTQWLGDGRDCPQLGINIATHADVGGDGDGVEWVILSSNFK